MGASLNGCGIVFEPHLRLLTQFLDPCPRSVLELGMIPVFPTPTGKADSVPLPDQQKLFADGVGYEFAAMLFINEPIEIGANFLRECDVSASCAHG
jgi:hypothetical protein